MIKVVADDKIPFLQGVLEPYADVVYMQGSKIDRKSLMDADALLIRTRTKCTEELLHGTKVSFIATTTMGFDHIDTQYCEKNGILWINSPGCNSGSVQQYAVAAILKIATEFRLNLAEKTLGIVGVGNIGSKVEKFARLMGMRVLLNDPPRERKEGGENFVSLGTLLYEADIITVHVPLNVVGEDATWHLFNDRNFKKMKKGTWFINSSRGEVAETAALKKVLANGKLGGAALDVWENEPDLDIELMSQTFLSTPHIAGYSADGKANGTAIVVNTLCEKFDLPLKKWYPSEIPQPENPYLEIDCKGKSAQEIVAIAISHTYDIDNDNIKLKFSPSDFERQRGEYGIRREYPAFTVKLKAGSPEIKKLIKAIGFKVI